MQYTYSALVIAGNVCNKQLQALKLTFPKNFQSAEGRGISLRSSAEEKLKLFV